jgi:symplekin
MVKSMEKTTRSLLIHINKRYAHSYNLFQKTADMYSDPKNSLSGRIQQYVERMMRSRSEIFDEANKKRGHPEYIDGLDPAKRQKLGEQGINTAANRLHVPPLAPGPHTVGELFTITTDEALKAFDVAQLSEDLVVKIGVTILQRLDFDVLNQAIEVSALSREFCSY